jgi:threonyl-tRNA synthetase
VVLSKDDALEMFKQNPFKVQLITAKIPENGKTIAYRCGNLIDLCTGPHLPDTGRVKSMRVTKASSSYWLAKKENDDL